MNAHQPHSLNFRMLFGRLALSVALWMGLLAPGNSGAQVASPVCPASILFGELVQCSLDATGEVDSYIFTGSAGDMVLVGMSAGGTLDPEVQLYGPGGGLLETAWSYSHRTELTYMLDASGSYTIRASDYGGNDTASYGLFLQRLTAPDHATAIVFGQTLTGTVALLGERGSYAFTADAGDVVLVGMSGGGTIEPDIQLYGPDGRRVGSAQSYGHHAEFTHTLPLSGGYVILTGDDDATEAADYGVFLQRLTAPGKATSIAFGETLTDTLALLGEMGSYTFAAEAGDAVLVGMSSNGYVEPSVHLYGPDGALLGSDWSYGHHAEFTHTLTATGSYTILTSDDDATEAAGYGVFVQRLNNPGNAMPLVFGQALTGTLALLGERDSYAFIGDAGDVVLVEMSSGSLDPSVRLYGPDGGLLDADWSYGNTAEIRRTLPVTGSYLIYVGDYDGIATGGYTLSLQGGDTDLALPLGITQEILMSPGLPLIYRIDVPAGASNLFVTLQKYAAGYSELALQDESAELASASGSSDLLLPLPSPAAGSYTLTVVGAGRARLTAALTLPALTLGEWRTGTILHSWGSAWYQYTVPVGQSALVLNVETIGLWSELKVYRGAFESTPYWSASGPTMTLEIPSPVADTYYVHLMDSAWIQGDDQSRDHLIRADVIPVAAPTCIAPEITSFAPTQGGTAGPVTIQVQGQCFDAQPQVCLTRAGEEDVCAQQVTVESAGRSLAATFDLAASAAGEWALTVTDAAAQTATAATPFTVAAGGQAKVWVEIVGRQTVRTGRAQTVYVRYGNTGEVDAMGIPLWIKGIPADATWRLGIELTPPQQLPGEELIDWAQVPKYIVSGDEVIIPLVIPTIPPGYTGEIPIEITVPSNRAMQLGAQISPLGVLCAPGASAEKCLSGAVKLALDALPGANCALDVGCWIYNHVSHGKPGDVGSMIDDLVGVVLSCAGDAFLFTAMVNAVMDAIEAIGTMADCMMAAADAVLDIVAVSSVSPEDKFGPSGWDPPGTPANERQRWIESGRELTYRIDFWNKEDAPAATVDVIITDTLDTDLDGSTFRFTEVGFLDWSRQFEPTQSLDVDIEHVRIDLSPYYAGAPVVTMTVNVQATFDPATGEIHWEFHAREPGTFDPPEEPLAGFLPPITDSDWEIGWVGYTVAPKPGLPSGTIISNQSFVKFDLNPFNPAPPGGPYINTLDAAPPASSAQAPAGVALCHRFLVQWAGQDDAAGSGLESYDVYVDDLDDAASAYLWQGQTSDASASFAGAPGHRYGFYTRAHDHAGNIEPAPEPFAYDIEVTAGEYCRWLPILSSN